MFGKSHKIYCIALPSCPSPGPSITVKGILSGHSDTSNLPSIALTLYILHQAGLCIYSPLCLPWLKFSLTPGWTAVILPSAIHTHFCYFLFQTVFNDFWLSTEGHPKLPACLWSLCRTAYHPPPARLPMITLCRFQSTSPQHTTLNMTWPLFYLRLIPLLRIPPTIRSYVTNPPHLSMPKLGHPPFITPLLIGPTRSEFSLHWGIMPLSEYFHIEIKNVMVLI